MMLRTIVTIIIFSATAYATKAHIPVTPAMRISTFKNVKERIKEGVKSGELTRGNS